MNNDLISRSALKEAIRKRLCISSLKYLTEQEKVVVNEIEIAPTIEQNERPQVECKDCKYYFNQVGRCENCSRNHWYSDNFSKAKMKGGAE